MAFHSLFNYLPKRNWKEKLVYGRKILQELTFVYY